MKKSYREFDLPRSAIDPLIYFLYIKGFISEDEISRYNCITIPQYADSYHPIMGFIESLKEGE